jgi:hypothetical protein
MNLTDLTEVLHERAELTDPSHEAHEARMAGVRARVSATRRRRAVAGVACVVLALVGIVYAVLPRPEALPEPAVPPRSLPEYQSGTRLLAQAWGDLPSTSVTVRFTPKSLNFWMFTQCDVGKNRNLAISVTVNNRSFADGNGCGGGIKPKDWSSLGVVPGQPTVMTMTVLGELGRDEPTSSKVLPLPPSGTFALGIGEEVPVSEYPLPPRPQTLQPILPAGPGATIELKPDPADPVARKELTVEWPGPNTMTVQMNAPGRVRVLVNDVEVVDFSHWSYASGSTPVWSDHLKETYGLDLSEGQTVKITVIPERITGDWLVTLAPR